MMHPLSSEEEFKYGINLVKSKYLMVADIAYQKIKNLNKKPGEKPGFFSFI